MLKGKININDITNELAALREAVQQRISRSMNISSDFDFLASDISNQTRERIAVNTLKRLWGYSNGYATSRRFTLNVLARYAGFNDWEDFYRNLHENAASQVFNADTVDVLNLNPGQRLELRWHPERRVVIEYQGDNNFVVLESVNAKLKAGDSFRCQAFVNGQPLTITNLLHEGNDHPVNYICGKQGGITVKLI